MNNILHPSKNKKKGGKKGEREGERERGKRREKEKGREKKTLQLRIEADPSAITKRALPLRD